MENKLQDQKSLFKQSNTFKRKISRIKPLVVGLQSSRDLNQPSKARDNNGDIWKIVQWVDPIIVVVCPELLLFLVLLLLPPALLAATDWNSQLCHQDPPSHWCGRTWYSIIIILFLIIVLSIINFILLFLVIIIIIIKTLLLSAKVRITLTFSFKH